MTLVEKIADRRTSSQPHEDVIIFCSHPAVVTLGRATQTSDVTTWQGPILEVSRGGRATYHGPSQLVVYPILDLNKNRPHLSHKDIGAYLRTLEQVIISALSEFGVAAEGRSLQAKSSDLVATEETGVWVKAQKIASLGIAVKKWITYHGAAINLAHDPSAFQGLKPCGFSSQVMVSLEELISQPVNFADFQWKLQNYLQEKFQA